MTETTTLTEFEENVSFDADDPDFAPSPPVKRNVLHDSRYFVGKFDVKGRYILTFSLIANDALVYKELLQSNVLTLDFACVSILILLLFFPSIRAKIQNHHFFSSLFLDMYKRIR